MPPSGPNSTVAVSGCGQPPSPPLWQLPVQEGDTGTVTLNKDGSRLYIPRSVLGEDNAQAIVSVFDTKTHSEVAAMPVPGYNAYPGKIQLNPSQSKGYFPTNDRTVQVFDTATNTMATSIPVFAASRLAFSPDGTRLYAMDYNQKIHVIDAITDTVIDTWEYDIRLPSFSDIVVEPTGTYAYIASGETHVVDLKTGAIVDSIPVRGSDLTFSSDGRTLYVMDTFNRRTAVVDVPSKSVKATIPVSGYDFILSSSEKRAYIPMWEFSSIAVVDLNTNALICSHWMDRPDTIRATDAVLSPDNRTIYVTQSRPYFVAQVAIPEEKPSPRFTDTPSDASFHREITWLATAGITTGFDDHTFRPLEPVRRDAMAAFIYRFHGSPEFTPPPVSPFTDVSISDKFYKEITWLAANKISQGWPDQTYRPLEPVNRDAMAAFLYRTVDHARFIAPAESPFKDVQTDDPFYREISFVSALGVSTGWADGTFRPLQPVNRDAMAAFLFRLNPFAAFVKR